MQQQQLQQLPQLQPQLQQQPVETASRFSKECGFSRTQKPKEEKSVDDEDLFVMSPPQSPRHENVIDWVSGSQVKSVRLLKQIGENDRLTVPSHFAVPTGRPAGPSQQVWIPPTQQGRPVDAPKAPRGKRRPQFGRTVPQWSARNGVRDRHIPTYDALFDDHVRNLKPRKLKEVLKQRNLPQQFQYLLCHRMEEFQKARGKSYVRPRTAPTTKLRGIDWYHSNLHRLLLSHRHIVRDGEGRFLEDDYREVIELLRVESADNSNLAVGSQVAR